jgi:3'(2'), 5'-bisphosphate nucleotidase
MAYETELQVALAAARAAGDLLALEYQRFQRIPDAPADVTTEADRQSQETILKQLRSQFPKDAYCAEEDTPSLREARRSGPRLWIVDPIDGTRGFARKNGEFSVMIGLVEDGRAQIGVVLEPARRRLTYAVRGGGCWCQDDHARAEKCWVSSTATLTDATLTQSHSKSPHVPSEPVRELAPRHVVESYSAGLKLALVARGEADVYVNTYPAFSDWDICAGQILVEEAGGIVTGLSGQELVYSGRAGQQQSGLLAANPLIHAATVGRVRLP